jgi:3-hydroxyacyl-[acyl-carrier-protein] dehydratase
MLKDKLYKINTIAMLPRDWDDTSIQKYSAIVELESAHEIFQGHFPGNPILPGVCQVEMVREVAEEITGMKLSLTQAGHVKYLNLVNPLHSPVLNLDLKLTTLNPVEMDVSAEITSPGNTYMKMKGRFNAIKP